LTLALLHKGESAWAQRSHGSPCSPHLTYLTSPSVLAETFSTHVKLSNFWEDHDFEHAYEALEKVLRVQNLDMFGYCNLYCKDCNCFVSQHSARKQGSPRLLKKRCKHTCTHTHTRPLNKYSDLLSFPAHASQSCPQMFELEEMKIPRQCPRQVQNRIG
jgi:hypothetical protein